MVALGSVMSGFWIIVANSWQQTPVAYKIVEHNGITRAVITDFWEMVFNPSAMPRFLHTILGSYVQGTFLVISVSAYFILKKKHFEFAKKSIFIALTVAGLSSILQPVIGHWHAQIVAKYQPVKLAAFEGHFETQKEAPLTVLGWVDVENEKTYGIKIPKLLSYLIANDKNHIVPGLKDFPKSDWPNVQHVFQSYHLMIALGTLFMFLSFISLYLHFKDKLYQNKLIMKFYVFSVVLPVIANQAGWYSAERGRQPWLVHGLLRTADGTSPNLQAWEVKTSLILFFLIYILLFFSWLYILNKEIKHGPDDHHDSAHYGKTNEIAKEVESILK